MNPVRSAKRRSAAVPFSRIGPVMSPLTNAVGHTELSSILLRAISAITFSVSPVSISPSPGPYPTPRSVTPGLHASAGFFFSGARRNFE